MKNHPQSVVLALLSVAFISLAQLAMKWGMTQLSLQFPSLQELWHAAQYSALVSNYLPYYISVVAGLSFYALSMLCWVMALKHLPLSLAYPMLSLSYVIVYVAAISLPWIGEAFSWPKALGIVLILAGIYLVFPSKKAKQS